MEEIVIRSAIFLIAVGSLATSAAAMPSLNQAAAISRPDLIMNAKIVCEQDGRCYELRRRPPVARWIYGSDAFHCPGSYVGPRYYGRPGSHWSWWGFLSF